MDPKYILVVLVGVIMLWFSLGMLYNIRLGNRLLKWMQGGLPRIGQKTTFRWLGSTVAELVIAQGKGVVRKAEILAALAPRDVAWNWLIAQMSGRRDVLIVRIDLPKAPHVPLELADPTTWTGRLALRERAAEGWQERPLRGQTLMAPAGLLDMAQAALEKLDEPLRRLAPATVRVALRREHPHLELHLPLPDMQAVSAEAFFDALVHVCEQI